MVKCIIWPRLLNAAHIEKEPPAELKCQLTVTVAPALDFNSNLTR